MRLRCSGRDEVARKIEDVLAKTPGVQYTTSVVGFSLLSFVRTSYNGFFFVTLKPWDQRKSRDVQLQEIKQRINRSLSQIPEGIAFSFSPPSIPGVGTSGGFTFALEDRAGNDVSFLANNLQTFMNAARKRPEIANLSTTFLPSVPQQFVDVDRDKVLKQQVAVNDVYRTLQAFMGGLFINYFNRFGRQWQVYIEAEGDYRTRAENVGQFYVRNSAGAMVPLAALTRFEPRPGPEFTMRYNEYRAAQINGAAAPGYSADQATAALEEVFAQTMPREMGFDYMGMSFQEKKAQQGVPAWVVFAFSLLFVFLILAALYESWSLPFSVLLSTPVAVFGAFFMLWLRRTVLQQLFAGIHGADRGRCLFADRSGHVDRAGGEERDFDCGVCEGRIREREAAGGCGAGRRAVEVAADFDDVVRVYFGHGAAVDGDRCGFGGAADHGHDGDRRNAGGEFARRVFHSGCVLCGGEVVGRGARNAAGACVAGFVAGAGRLR